MSNRNVHRFSAQATVVALVLAAGLGFSAWANTPKPAASAGLELIEEYLAPGLESELSGIYPHPTLEHHYFAVANRHPVYPPGQEPMLAPEHRGKLLVVNGRTGEVARAFDLVDGDYGDLAFGDGHLFVSSLEPAEILKVDPESGKVVARLPLAGPAGGLEYDADRSLLIAQIYVGHPHLALVEPSTGATVDTLWSDESAMGLAKVGGDLLCTWASRFDEYAASELRLIDQETGHVKGRLPLDAVHTSMAPTDAGFLSLVSLERASGKVGIRKYGYDHDLVSW